MTHFSHGLVTATALVAMAFAADIRTARAAQELNANEKLYEELFKLPAEERLKRMVEGANKEGSFDVIPNYRGKQMQDHVAIFKKRYPGINVKISDLNSYEALERVVAEEAVGKHLTDASKMNLPDYVAIDGKNLPARYPTPATQRILPKYRAFLSAENLWVPQSTSEEGVSYHAGLVKAGEEPKSWMDLCHPRFKGQVAYDVGEPLFLAGMYNQFDRNMDKFKAFMECVGKNEPLIIRGNTVRINLMAAGDHAVQGGNSFYQVAQLSMGGGNKRAPLKIAYEIPTTVFSSVIWINRNAVHPYTAALYADWVVSEESQDFLAKELRGPITRAHPFLPDDAQIVVLNPVDPKLSAELQGYWKQYIGKK
jgi:ABC-type Fe3+ transport system substrate-binding protein